MRSYLAIRVERSRNVVNHPAARIIMSISAIFLLFKLESGEAHAKGLSEKQSCHRPKAAACVSSTRPALHYLRAQSAFSRAFDSVDAPANAAMLAGMILASELVLSNGGNFRVKPISASPSYRSHEEVTIQPLTELDEHKSTTKPVAADNAEKQKTENGPGIAQNQNQDAISPAIRRLHLCRSDDGLKRPMCGSVKVAEIAPQQQAVVKGCGKGNCRND